MAKKRTGAGSVYIASEVYKDVSELAKKNINSFGYAKKLAGKEVAKRVAETKAKRNAGELKEQQPKTRRKNR